MGSRTVSMIQGERMHEQRRVVVFGASSFASLMTSYIEAFTAWEIVAYAVDREYCAADDFCGKPLLPVDEVAQAYPPSSFDAFVAVGYNQMGDIRRKLFFCAKNLGFRILSFIHPTALCYATSLGEGNILLEGSEISMHGSFGDGNILFNGALIAHDVTVGSFNTFCAGCIVAGEVKIEDNCFFGVASAVRNGISLASSTFVGMGEKINSSTKSHQAFISSTGTRPHKMPSEKVMKFFELSE